MQKKKKKSIPRITKEMKFRNTRQKDFYYFDKNIFFIVFNSAVDYL